MADVMAIVSRDVFEGTGVIAEVGTRLEMDRYTSTSKHLHPLAGGGRMFLVTVRPHEQLWLVAVLDNPQFDGIEWVAHARSALPITDITHLRAKLVFKSGKGIAPGASLGQSLQTPRVLVAADVALLDATITGAASPEPAEPPGSKDPPDWEPRVAQGHRIELARSTRSKCATCDAPIMKGQARVAELYKHGDIASPIYRYHHIECAIDACPLVVRNALDTVIVADGIVDRDAIAARVAARLERERTERRQRYEATAAAARAAAAPPAERPDGALASLLDQLAAAPDDAAVLGVLADELQARGDARGELIATQLALATAKSDGLIRRRDELMTELAPKLEHGDRCLWSTGFVRRLELTGKTANKLDEMIGLWRHPSLRFLRELRITFFTPGDATTALPALCDVLPPTVRRLELASATDDMLAQLARALPAVEIVLPQAPAPPAPPTVHKDFARHTGKPEWGRGKIIRRFDGKLEIKFPKIGNKVFRADAPFLELCD